MNDEESNTIKNSPNGLLYRYRTLNHALDEIKEEYIYMTCPTKFNDPFDCWLSLEGCDDDILQNFREFNLDGSNIIVAAMRGDRSNLVMREYLQILSRVRICCFSERNDSLSMWTHYGKEHSGICIGYDYRNMVNLNINPVKVEYSTEMKVKPFINGFTKLQDKDIYNAFLNKSIEFDADEEWRVIRRADQSDKVKVNECIDSIYIGVSCCNLSDKEKEDMMSIVNVCKSRSIPVYLMRRSFTEYKLEPALIYGPGEPVDFSALSAFEHFTK